MLYAVSVSDFLSGLICPVQLDVAAVQNRLDTSEAEWRATSETCCSDSGGFTAWSRMAVINWGIADVRRCSLILTWWHQHIRHIWTLHGHKPYLTKKYKKVWWNQCLCPHSGGFFAPREYRGALYLSYTHHDSHPFPLSPKGVVRQDNEVSSPGDN